ncbi:helix-turn-helix domain-containing protein [uncultured Cohaesibacter sp.]|uniref:helix-turn-helix domain-containing protein n=1 Tax=uncultured Cohaesibacter sp. TaxID=1002546 RepID=UPI00292DEFAB|nr:helix-turn-helix domain-containing protein [uncultured Cohaesibacter sp.]
MKVEALDLKNLDDPQQEWLMETQRMGENRRVALSLVDELVARTFRMPRTALHAGTRCRKSVAFARQVAMYLSHVCLSYPLKDIAEHYRRDRTTVAYACRVVEDKREQEETELLINSLESALETMMLVTPLTSMKR